MEKIKIDAYENDRVSRGWRTSTIILIVLLLLETSLMVYSYNVGVEYNNYVQQYNDNRLDCSNNICNEVVSDSFIYEPETKMCYCYLNNEVVLSRFIK